MQRVLQVTAMYMFEHKSINNQEQRVRKWQGRCPDRLKQDSLPPGASWAWAFVNDLLQSCWLMHTQPRLWPCLRLLFLDDDGFYTKQIVIAYSCRHSSISPDTWACSLFLLHGQSHTCSARSRSLHEAGRGTCFDVDSISLTQHPKCPWCKHKKKKYCHVE